MARYHDGCVIAANDGWMGKVEMFDLCYGLGGVTVGGYHIFSIFCSVFVFLLNVLS